MSKSISRETREAILDTAWALLEAPGRGDLGQAELARAAGVSRQTLFYAFGARSGLLSAMVRHRSRRSAGLARLLDEGARPDVSVAQLERIVAAWLDYLPEVLPAETLLAAEAQAGPAAQLARALRAGLRCRLAALAEKGMLRPGLSPDEAADTLWAWIQIPAWRLLVEDLGWSAERFRSNRLRLLRTAILSDRTRFVGADTSARKRAA